jgi:adenosylcobinamide-GDP ribazoletransferase
VGFRAAIRFLTILPVRGGDAPPGRAAAFFPLVGAMLGAAGAGVYLLAAKVFPVSIAALATVAFWIAISGVLHEDGLADVADAVRAGRTRERVLAILKDSRIGTYGAVAILLSVLARWQALEYLATPRVLETMIAAQAVPRAAMVAMAWCSRPAGSGLGYALASTLGTPAAVAAIAQGAAAALLCGWRPGLAMMAGSVLIVQASRGWFYVRLGGVNGDCLGFTEQLIEIFVLLMFACGSCAWD